MREEIFFDSFDPLNSLYGSNFRPKAVKAIVSFCCTTQTGSIRSDNGLIKLYKGRGLLTIIYSTVHWTESSKSETRCYLQLHSFRSVDRIRFFSSLNQVAKYVTRKIAKFQKRLRFYTLPQRLMRFWTLSANR